MAYTFDNYHHLGMDNFDGGIDRWDFNHDGEMSIFEENSRRAYDQVMFDSIFGEEEKHSSDDWDDDLDDDFCPKCGTRF
jgi:hypothetical protein